MQTGTTNSSKSTSKTDEIDLKALFRTIWNGKWLVIGTSLLFGLVAVVVVLNLPNVYKSDVLLAPAEENSGGGLSALANQFGGLASLAGVDLNNGAVDKTKIAIEQMKSREFLTQFIERRNLKAVLMAVKGWDPQVDQLIYDEDIYDVVNDQWVRDVAFPKKVEPSLLEVRDFFLKENLVVSENKDSGLVTVAIKHYSPSIAQRILTQLISDLNVSIKQRDITEASESINYLTAALKETKLDGVKETLYTLIEQQQQTKMLATIREEYAFKVIDSALLPEEKDSPSRGIIVALYSLLGAFLSVITLLTFHAVRRPS